MKAALSLISASLVICVTMPIWYFILHSILSAIHADRLLWFLFWIYVPVGLFAAILSEIAKRGAEKS